MSGEIIAILAVGITLAGVIIASVRGVRQDITRLESRLDGRIDALGTKLDGRIDALGAQLGELRERMAHLEDLLEGLREAITVRAAAS